MTTPSSLHSPSPPFDNMKNFKCVPHFLLPNADPAKINCVHAGIDVRLKEEYLVVTVHSTMAILTQSQKLSRLSFDVNISSNPASHVS